MICCIMLTGCGAAPSEQDIGSKEDIIKDSQVHTTVEAATKLPPQYQDMYEQLSGNIYQNDF